MARDKNPKKKRKANFRMDNMINKLDKRLVDKRKELKKVKVKTSGLRAEVIKEKIFNKRLKAIQDKKNDL